MSTNRLLISVIVPIYNAEKTLMRCIDSIYKQSLQNLEIILINDGSTDSTSYICDELAKKDNRIIVINQQNTGAGFARNRGLEIAKGEYISFVDSDDEIDINTYNDVYKKMKETNADICLFPVYVNTVGKKTKLVNNHIKDKLYSNKEAIHNAIKCGIFYTEWGANCCMAMFSHKLIQKYSVRFPDIKEYLSEDLIFKLYAAFNSNIIQVLCKSYYHQYHEIKFNTSYSTSYRKGEIERSKKMYFKIIEIYEQYQLRKSGELHAAYFGYIYILSQFKISMANILNIGEQQVIKEIKSACNDVYVQNIVDIMLKEKIKLRERIFLNMLKFKFYRLIYLLFKIERFR